MLAVDDNGFVSNYWYDADGERTVKISGDGSVVYVNSLFSGGDTQTAKFSLYVSPYLVANQGGRYTKHIYIGSQRIVSKLGDLQSYGVDPRRIPYAGSESDNISVDYKKKYEQQQQVIKDNYATFEVPYNGKDNDNYVDGDGFCCSDKNDVGTRSFTPGENDNYEHAQFYYHPDHLGSSSFITNLDGDVVQHIEYVPFGEVFIEERNNVWNTPYLFNAKELDEETGLYYYGARYYDSRISLWLSTDPLQEKYPDMSSYIYCVNNPVNLIDPDGKNPIYDKKGNFLGIDNKGLKGRAIIMDKTNFELGMEHSRAKELDLGKKTLSIADKIKVFFHHLNLKFRPDYDGFVTVSEGVEWARKHAGALENPTPDNMLYINTARLNFGNIFTSKFNDIGEITPINLFNVGNVASSVNNTRLRGTVYALGRVYMRLLDRKKREVEIVNDWDLPKDRATDYDWNRGGDKVRQTFIDIERARTGLNDSHGFRVFYYGIGKLNKQIGNSNIYIRNRR